MNKSKDSDSFQVWKLQNDGNTEDGDASDDTEGIDDIGGENNDEKYEGDDDGGDKNEDDDEGNDDLDRYFLEAKKRRMVKNVGQKAQWSNKKSEILNAESKNSTTPQNSFAKNYLLNFGYKEGCGLGKHQDGIIEPLEATKQKGRRGFGFKPVNLEASVSKYDLKLETISVDECVIWLKNENLNNLDKNLLKSWVKIGSVKKSVDNYSPFCETEVLNDIFSSKNVLNSITAKDLENGRRRSNPFEAINKAIFLNRAAMKIANLDAILNRMFTEPRSISGEKLIGPDNLLYFADVCAGPGGFSEYVFFRKKWRAKGFGFTLRNDKDFLLDQFWAGPSETFEPHYGENGDGNIFIPENITSFSEHVLKYTDGEGVHFMMADGGVKIEEKFNDQELICKKLYLCQCIVALLIVRTHGHFVVKLFDLFTPFSVGLIYLMYRSFSAISIIKPNTSRPANSERYLVCKHKRDDCKDIADHLFSINKMVSQYEEKQKEDVLELVPINVLKGDIEFYKYITASNIRIGKNQIISLNKLAAFSEDPDLKEEKQQELRRECLLKWDIPHEARAEPKKYDARTKCKELLGVFSLDGFEYDTKKNTVHSFDSFKESIVPIDDWHCVVINEEPDKNSCAFYLGLGRSNVNKYTRRGWMKWDDGLNAHGLCLPANTLVYGEIVPELIGEGKSQSKRFAFHIIDGLFLGGEDIRDLPMKKRWQICKLFAKSLNKENFPVRMKNYVELRDFNLLLEKVMLKSIKASSCKKLCFPVEQDIFFRAGGVIFFKDTKGSWHRHWSFRCNRPYFYHNSSRNSIFEDEVNRGSKSEEIYADFKHTFNERRIWWWDSGVVIDSNQMDAPDLNKMQAKDLLDHIRTSDKRKLS